MTQPCFGSATSACLTRANGASIAVAGSATPVSSPTPCSTAPPPCPPPEGREIKKLSHRRVLVGAELAHCLPRPAIERGVGVDQVAQLVTGDLQLDGELEDSEEIAAPRTHRRGADEHAAVGVLDHLDEPLVAGSVNPAPGGDRCLLDPGAYLDSLPYRLLLGEPGRAHFGIGECNPRLGSIV